MRKVKLFTMGILMALCMTACGGQQETVSAAAGTEHSEAVNQSEDKPADSYKKGNQLKESSTEEVEKTEKVQEDQKESEPVEVTDGWTVEELRALSTKQGDLCAAAFLGYGTDIASFLSETDLTAYPFLSEIPEENYIENPNGGTEIYCIIPADPLSTLSVNEWIVNESNGFCGETGQVFYRVESGEPILLRTNPSDAVPGTQVVIVDNSGQGLIWNPSLSLYDGTMNIPWSCPGVTDVGSLLMHRRESK